MRKGPADVDVAVALRAALDRAIDQQRAISDLLQAMKRAPGDLDDLLRAVCENARRLCGTRWATVWLRDPQGDYVIVAESRPPEDPPTLLRTLAERPGRDSLVGRTALQRDVVMIPDVLADPEYARPDDQRSGGFRAVLGVPLMHDGEAIGVITNTRAEPGPFSPDQVELVRTFADQAVIAIEHARLMTRIQETSRQVERANRHKSEFLANMSHELRTPLHAIIGFTKLLLRGMGGPIAERQREYLQDVLTSGKHLLALINDVLDLSKVEAGRLELELAEVGMPELVESAVTFVRERAVQHGITLAVDIAPDVGAVIADARKVKQVLVNLLSNAVKFTPDGGWVGVTARRDGDTIEIAVRDTGIGIAAEDQPKVFEEFRQVGTVSERSREGTGLGLTLARRFIELHGGRIRLESEIGKGSTFTFTLPVRDTAAARVGA